MSQWMPFQQQNPFMPQGMGGVQVPMALPPLPQKPQSRFQKPPKPDEKKPMEAPKAPSALDPNSNIQMLPSMSMSMSMPFMPTQLSPDEKAMMEAQRNKITSLMDQQRNRQQGQIQQMRQALNEYKQNPRGIDFTGGLMLADMLNRGTANPSNLTFQYLQSGMRPESEQQKMANIMDMENRIATQQDRAAGNEIDLAKAHMKSLQDRASMSSQLRYMSRLRGQDLSLRKFWENESNDAQKEILKFTTKLTNEAAEKAQQFDQLKGAFARGDYQSVISNLAVYARAVSGERGVLTDGDIQRVLPRNWNAGVAKFFAQFSEVPTEQLPPDFNKNLMELVELAQEKTAKRYVRAVDTHQQNANSLPYYGAIKEYTDKTYQNQREALKEMYGIGEDSTKTETPDDPMATIKAIEEELKRRRAAK